MKRWLVLLPLTCLGCVGQAFVDDDGSCDTDELLVEGFCRPTCLHTSDCGDSAYCAEGACFTCPLSGCPDLCADDAEGDGDDDDVCVTHDNCPQTANPSQADADLDGVGDACDSCPADASNDGDGDSVCNDVDTCPDAPNPAQTDSDGDGPGDACDACPLDPLDDSDHDGVCAPADMCPDAPDPEQLDSDGDGTGDACDPCPFAPADDRDGDATCDDADACPDDPTRDARPCLLVMLPSEVSSHWGATSLGGVAFAGDSWAALVVTELPSGLASEGYAAYALNEVPATVSLDGLTLPPLDFMHGDYLLFMMPGDIAWVPLQSATPSWRMFNAAEAHTLSAPSAELIPWTQHPYLTIKDGNTIVGLQQPVGFGTQTLAEDAIDISINGGEILVAAITTAEGTSWAVWQESIFVQMTPPADVVSSRGLFDSPRSWRFACNAAGDDRVFSVGPEGASLPVVLADDIDCDNLKTAALPNGDLLLAIPGATGDLVRLSPGHVPHLLMTFGTAIGSVETVASGDAVYVTVGAGGVDVFYLDGDTLVSLLDNVGLTEIKPFTNGRARAVSRALPNVVAYELDHDAAPVTTPITSTATATSYLFYVDEVGDVWQQATLSTGEDTLFRAGGGTADAVIDDGVTLLFEDWGTFRGPAGFGVIHGGDAVIVGGVPGTSSGHIVTHENGYAWVAVHGASTDSLMAVDALGAIHFSIDGLTSTFSDDKRRDAGGGEHYTYTTAINGARHLGRFDHGLLVSEADGPEDDYDGVQAYGLADGTLLIVTSDAGTWTLSEATPTGLEPIRAGYQEIIYDFYADVMFQRDADGIVSFCRSPVYGDTCLAAPLDDPELLEWDVEGALLREPATGRIFVLRDRR